MSYISSIPTTRVANQFVVQRLLGQTQSSQLDLLRLETQLSTGYRFSLPGEDPSSAMRVISLQSMLERTSQVQSNISTNQGYLTATDSALSTVAGVMDEARGAAMAAIGTTASVSELETAATTILQGIDQLAAVGNSYFNGRYLFGGSATDSPPFELSGGNLVKYLGNDTELASYSGLDTLFTTNLTGDEAFGAMSESVQGTADLNPILTFPTRLEDLRGGQGISEGSITVSNGTKLSTIDLSGARTIGEVASLIQSNPPQGSVVTVEVTATGLEVSLDSGNLTIREVGGGTTARDLGILATTGVGTGPVVGSDLDPLLRSTTRLEDIFGTRACAFLHSAGTDNDVIIEADHRGTDLNGITVSYYDDGTVTEPGSEVVTYDDVAGTLRVNIKTGFTRASHVVAAVNAAYDPTTSPFTASLDLSDEQNGGRGLVDVTASAETRNGSGFDFDQDSGIQIVNGGETHTITFSAADGVETVEDLLNAITGSGASVRATINEDGTGIDIRSLLSGSDLMIGENGGTTAAELGIRSLNGETPLAVLNYGRGVEQADSIALAASTKKTSTGSNNDLVFTARNTGPEWNAFSVQFVEKVPAGAETLTYDPVAKTMVFAVNPGVTTAADVVQLFNATAGARDDFQIALDDGENGGNDGSGFVSSGTASSVVAASAGDNNDLLFQARNSDPAWDGFAISFEAGVPPGTESFTYDPVAKTMVFAIDPGVTTANRAIELFEADAQALADFSVTTASEGAGPNTGNGFVAVAPGITTAGGAADTAALTADGISAEADFTITRSDGLAFEIDLSGAETINDVLNLINTNADNLGSGAPLVARLATDGNGIELVDTSGGGGTLTVTRSESSIAAIDLGLIPSGQQSASGVTGAGGQVLTGSDTNPQETEGLFTALIRMYDGLKAGDTWEVQRSIEMLDERVIELNLCRGELGIQQQGLDGLAERMANERVEVKSLLSVEYDADFVETVSNLTAKQTAFEASLMATSQILQLTLLNYL